MKYLIVRSYPSVVDFEHATYNVQELGLARALVRLGHEVGIVCFGKKSEDKCLALDNKLVSLYVRNGLVYKENVVVFGLQDIVKRYNVVQTAEYSQLQSWLLAMRYPQKTIIYHGPYYSPFMWRYNRFCKLFDMCFLWGYKLKHTRFVTKSPLAEAFLRGKGLKNVRTVGVGIDVDALQDSGQHEFVRSIPDRGEGINILYVGRYEDRRNIGFLYDVVKEVKRRKSNVRFISVGRKQGTIYELFEDGYHIERLEQKHLAALYRKCDVFLLPTRYEIFGMVLLEAMYYGLKVLTTNNGGASTLIDNERNGYVLELNKELWADCILKQDHRIGENASQTISSRFTWSELAPSFIQAALSINN